MLGSADPARSTVDDVRDGSGLRDMAAGLIHRLRTGTVGHHALGGDGDHLVVGRYEIPGGLAFQRHLTVQGVSPALSGYFCRARLPLI